MKKYDIWLLDKVSETIIETENGLTISEAKQWWRLWNKLKSDCACIIVPQGFVIPETVSAVPKASQAKVA